MDIKNIVAQHPESVALSFLKWGIDAPVNEKTVTAAIVAKGDDFIEDLGNIIGNQVQVQNFDGVLGFITKIFKKKTPL